MNALSFFSIFLSAFIVLPVSAATCDPSGVQACQQWARAQIQAKSCNEPTPTFENAVEDLYLNKGCRLEGTRWYNLETNADVKGSLQNGLNTDTAGCISRYTPSSYLKSGGYFRTPKEAMNGPLRNKSLSGCELPDANSITASVLAGIQSCTCASITKTPLTASAGATPPTGGTGAEQPAGEPEATLQGNTDAEPFVALVPSALQNQFRNLAKKYFSDIPTGTYGRDSNQDSSAFQFMSAGSVNNILGGNATACGAYQGTVIDWLDKLRTSSNPEEQKLLEGFEFGPIQIAGGAHQAVVLFPKGTDWKSTGIVFDPWKDQKPKLYSIAGTDNLPSWCKLFWLGLGCPPKGSVGNFITPIDANTGRYPTTPNPDGSWQYPGDLARATRTPGSRKKISVGSPVQGTLVAADGKRLGITAAGVFVNDFGADVEAEMMSSPDGTYQTTFNAPDGNYSLQFTGTGSGDVHVWTQSDPSGLNQFQPVHVKEGDHLQLAWSGQTPSLTDTMGNGVPTTTSSSKPKGFRMMIVGIFLVIIIVVIAIVLIVKRRSSGIVPPSTPV